MNDWCCNCYFYEDCSLWCKDLDDIINCSEFEPRDIESYTFGEQGAENNDFEEGVD